MNAFFKSSMFNQIVGMVNCLKKTGNPNESVKKLILGLGETVKLVIKNHYVDVAMDFFCQWDKVHKLLNEFEKALNPENKSKQWEMIAQGVAHLLEILKV